MDAAKKLHCFRQKSAERIMNYTCELLLKLTFLLAWLLNVVQIVEHQISTCWLDMPSMQ